MRSSADATPPSSRANFLDAGGKPGPLRSILDRDNGGHDTFLDGNHQSISQQKGAGHFEYDFTLLSGAAGLIYGYTGVIPIALWGF
jgi:hypothetical protein